jgi:hypothetical protein
MALESDLSQATCQNEKQTIVYENSPETCIMTSHVLDTSWGQCYKTFYARNLRIFV